MKNNDKSENLDMSNQDLFEIVLDLSRKINEIHQLHFSEPQLLNRKNQKQKFLAEILVTPAKTSKKR